jgi:SAM-dependent methyltransferase
VRRGAAAPGGEPYERLGPLYDRWCAGVDHDIPFYVLACEGAAGPIIELGAGSGRIAVELARHGHRVIALDAAPAMLAQAERRARRYGVGDLLEFVLGDLRDPPDLSPSDRVVAPFRTFMHLAGDDERRRALSAAAGLLADGGQFVFDVFEPSAADIRATHDRWIARREGISERPSWDAAERRLELEVRLPGRIVPMTLEWRSAAEWRELCAEAGLEVLAAYAGFEGLELTDHTGDQVYVCGRAPVGQIPPGTSAAARTAPALPRSRR